MTALAIIDQLSPVEAGSADAAVIAIHALDALATLHGARDTAEGAALERLFGEDDPALRAAGQAAVIRFSECDSIHLASCVTPGCVAVPVAAEFARDEQTFADAVAAAHAIGIALGCALGGADALARGVWPTLLAAPAMAAVGTAVALGLDREKTAHALTLALSAASGRAGRPGGYPSGRWYLLGEATLKGVRTALAARAGVSGDLSLPSPDWLAAQAPPELARPDQLDRMPAQPVEKTGLKPFVTARQGANGIEAFANLLDRGLQPETIRSIDVALPPIALPVVARPLRLDDRLSTIAHLGLQLGIAAWERDRLLDIGREAPYREESIALAAEVSITADRALDDPSGRTWPARVVVHTGSGGTLEAKGPSLPGDAGDPGQAAVVARKLERFCGPDFRAALGGWQRGKWGALLDAGLRQIEGDVDTLPGRATG